MGTSWVYDARSTPLGPASELLPVAASCSFSVFARVGCGGGTYSGAFRWTSFASAFRRACFAATSCCVVTTLSRHEPDVTKYSMSFSCPADKMRCSNAV